MPKEFGRNRRVGEQMRRELATLIQLEMKDPRVGMVTISEVRVTQDLSQSKVYVTTLGSSEERDQTIKLLNKAASFFRRELAHRMSLRSVPVLHFVYDESVERGVAMDALIAASIAADRRSDPS